MVADSVGKIALDIDLRANLNKQLKDISGNIGKQMTEQINSSVNRSTNSFRKTLRNAFRIPKGTFKVPKDAFDMSKITQGDDILTKTLDNINQQMDIQRQKLQQLRQEYNQGLSEKTKFEIEQLSQIMAASEHRIESLRIKLRELQFSYENATSPERKNKLLEEIAKTEAQMTTLIARSDRALNKINELEDGLSGEKRNALRERIVRTEASLLSLGKRAERVQKEMIKTDKGFDRVARGATKAENPVNRLGRVFDSTRDRMQNMTNSFTAGFRRIAKQVLVFAVMYKAIRGFQSYMGDAMRANDEFSRSLQQVRANLQTAFAPILQAVMPLLQAFINWLAKATAYIAAFISAIFGTTYQQSHKAAQGINTARNAMDGFGKSAGKAAKEAKKAHRQLAGFDEINTIADSSADSSGSGAGGVGGAGGIAPLVAPDMDMTGIQAKMDALAEKIRNGFSRTWEGIKNGWNRTVELFGPGLAKAWAIMQPQLETWKERFSNVFADIRELGAPLANWIEEDVVPLWENGITSLATVLAGFSETIGMMFDTVWEFAYPVLEKLIEEGLPRVTEFFNGFIDIGREKFLLVKQIFDDIWQGAVDPAMSMIKDITLDGLDIVFGLWDKWGPKILGNISKSLDGVKKLWKNLWEKTLKPITDIGLSFLSDLWDEHLRDLIKEIGNFVGKLITSAQEILNKFIMPIVGFLTKTLGPVFTVVFGSIAGTIAASVGTIADIIKGLLKIFGGLIDFLTGVFTGNWRKAWQGLADIFRGIANTLVAIIKAPLNGIIGAVNGAIRGLNKIKVPNWVPGLGGKGINIPQIPKLAKGGIIDQPTIAMVGEDGGEAVMPLERNTGWINNLAGQLTQQMGGSGVGNDEVITVLKQNNEILTQILVAILNSESEIIIKLQETELGRAVIKAINNLQRQAGYTLLDV